MTLLDRIKAHPLPFAELLGVEFTGAVEARMLNRGVLINTISIGGWAPTPFAAAYTASKFGLRGFAASLRQEPAGHTPTSAFAGCLRRRSTRRGLVHRAICPVAGSIGGLLYQSEDAAETFVRLVRYLRGEAAVRWPGRAQQMPYAAAPDLMERLIALCIGSTFDSTCAGSTAPDCGRSGAVAVAVAHLDGEVLVHRLTDWERAVGGRVDEASRNQRIKRHRKALRRTRLTRLLDHFSLSRVKRARIPRFAREG